MLLTYDYNKLCVIIIYYINNFIIYEQEEHEMIITIANIKGGVGKSTTCLGLASSISFEEKQNVTVFDADPQGTVTEWFYTAADLDEPFNFSIMSANVATLMRIEDKADCVFLIDCPPSGKVMDVAVDVADLVIVPTSSSPADLAKMWETVSTLKSNGKEYSILLTKVESNTLSYKSAISEFEENKVQYFKNVIPKREAISTMFGHSFDTSNLFGYQEVWNEIKGQYGE